MNTRKLMLPTLVAALIAAPAAFAQTAEVDGQADVAQAANAQTDLSDQASDTAAAVTAAAGAGTDTAAAATDTNVNAAANANLGTAADADVEADAEAEVEGEIKPEEEDI